MTSTAVTKKREAVHAVLNAANSYRLITYGDVHCDRALKCCAGEMEFYNLRDGDHVRAGHA